MGNEANSIHQQPTTPTMIQCKTLLSSLDHLPRANHALPKSETFSPDSKKSLPKEIAASRKFVGSKSFINDTDRTRGFLNGTEKGKAGRMVRSIISSSSPSILSKDSSSIVFIERSGKNCKLIPPSPLQSVDYARAAAREWTKRRASAETARGIDLSEYSPSDQQKSQTSAKSILNDYLLHTSDEIGFVNEHSKSAGRFSFGDTSNYPKYPSFLDSNDARRMSATALSELSSSGTPLNISLPRSDLHHESNSVAVSWPQGASPDESVMQCRNCLSCAIYTGNEKGLMQPEYNQQAQRVDYTSKLFAGSELLGVLPVGKQYPARRNQKLTKRMTGHHQAPSPGKVIKAD